MYSRTRNLGVGDRRFAIHGKWQAKYGPRIHLVTVYGKGHPLTCKTYRKLTQELSHTLLSCTTDDRLSLVQMSVNQWVMIQYLHGVQGAS